MLNKIFFVFCFSSIVTISTQAQNVLPNFKHITTNDGLPSSTVHFVMQDSKGYMWFATDHGVARYNGYEFRIFTTKDGLEDNTVFELYEDAKHRIWMLTFSGNIFYCVDGKITPFQYNKTITDNIKGAIPTKICVDSLDNIYLTTQSSGEFKIDKTGNLNKTINFNRKVNGAFLIHEIDNTDLLTSLEGSNNTKSLAVIYLKKSKQVDSLFLSSFKSPRFYAVRLDTDNLALSIFPYLYLYGNGKAQRVATNELPPILKLYKDKQNRLLACSTKGLFIFENILTSPVYTTYLPGEIVTSYFEDNEGGIWLSTLGNGVYYLPDIAIQNLYNQDKLLEKPVCLTNDLQSTIYSGYWSGVVSRIKNTEQKIIYKSANLSPVFSLYLDSVMKLHISSSQSLSLKLNNVTPLINALNKNFEIGNLKNNYVLHHDGFLYNAAQSSLKKISNDSIIERIEINHRINCLFETKQNQLLLGCKNGLYSFIDSTKNAIPYNNDIYNISIEDIKQFHEQICFATQGDGLYFFNGKENIVINESNGLISDLVNKIFVHENEIWCATNNGISHINFTDAGNFKYNITNITTKEGLPCNEINDITFLNDTLWIATNSGICFFDSRHDFKNPIAPEVYITSLRINGTDTIVQPNYSLNHDFNNLKISFVGISFKSQTDITYRYVLKTSKDSISGFTKNRDVDLLSLNPGDYTFAVQAKNSSGVWSKSAAVISFTIHPAWWQTWWFRIFISCLLALTVYLYYKRRLKRLNDKFDAERTRAALQLTALRAQMNPHFIFNVMNSIRNYIQKSDIASAQKYLTSFARLIRHTLDNSQVQEISLQEETNLLRIYAELEMQRFENAFDFKINCDSEIDMNETMIPSLLLQPFLENSIKHGIAHIETKGRISIDINKSHNKILIAIEDNGAGRQINNQWNEANHEKHISHGTSLTRDRIAAYNKAFNKNITTQTIDLKDENGNPCGTRVEIVIWQQE